jgi:CHAT domain
MNGKEIILQLGNGSLKKGFPTVNVELKGDDFDGWKGVASLLPNTELESAYQEWLNLYQASRRLIRSRGTTFHAAAGIQVSLASIHQTTQDLIAALNRWLNQGGLADIQSRLRTSLQVDDQISLSIITDDGFLWKLPWHQWDFVTAYEYCVESFSKSSVQSNRYRKLRANGRVDILAIVGNDPKLDLKKDLAALKQPRAKVTPRYPKSALDISNELSIHKQIRILFFGGHGDTIELELPGGNHAIGNIYLDNDTKISIRKIKEDLRAAIERGLQIAIFNCCSGWGLAQELADLNIPYLIAMRYKIPDELAQQFCSDLLSTYRKGGDFTAAFHHARNRLVPATDRDDDFESWLPMLVHNPESQRVTWQDLSRYWWQIPAPESVVKTRQELMKPDRVPLTWIGISLLSTAITMGLQTLAPVKELESQVVDRYQLVQANWMSVKSWVVVIDLNGKDEGVNEGRVVIGGDSISSESQLQELSKLKFAALGVDVKIEETASNSWLKTQPNVSLNCDRQLPMMTYAPKINDCMALALAVTKNYIPIGQTSAIDKSIVLNSHLSSKIDQIKLSDLSQLTKNNPDLLKDKILLVGYVKDKSSPVMIHAIATEQIIRSIHSRHPLLTRSDDRNSLWYILFWAGLSGASIFYARRLFPIATAIVLVGVGTGGILFLSGYLLPLVPVAIVVVVGSCFVYLIKLPNQPA